MTDDDWAPLPVDDLGAHPGEKFDLGRRTPAPPAPRVAPTPAPAPDPEAERMVAAFRRRLAQQPAAGSLIAALQHREQRLHRKQRAAASASLAMTVVRGVASPPSLAVDEVGSDLDPRELEPWFQELPHAEQERLRRQWFAHRHRHDGDWRAFWRQLRRAIAHGALLFFVMAVLQSLLLGGFALVLQLTLAGAAAAGIAQACRGDRFLYALCGSLAFVVVQGPTVFVQPLSLCSLLLASYGMAAVGMDREMRTSGGFRES